MLSCHQQADHHVCGLGVWHRCAVFVHTSHQIPYHVFAILSHLLRASCLDDVGVDLSHLPLSYISPSILGQWEPWEHEIDGLKTVVQIMIQLCESSVKLCADFLPLQGSRSGEESDLGHYWRHLGDAAQTLEVGGPDDEGADLVLH